MDLPKLREDYQQKIKEHEEHIQTLRENKAQHFVQEGNGPLKNITKQIEDEYHRHIEGYAALIAQIDAILGV
ncbi:hypothetical protein A6U87_14790 [Rhizobium sp. AC44/96]|jgi:phosphoenolpyruvate carboxylase|uniref:hypothetical protein n=1 Tax=unclassified Rhizobium TaxID=2613769 RepID=UPI00080FF797|nr:MULTISPECIES: hypothetical protein [unclassified Rhizobium]MDM9621088.1 hypothetical protein [Rhizobium sp. S96]OCJ05271.1 hypothetical protein A6U87_14790 [Rhizobium sp. AC44/96]